jgi:hypothetical protein
MGEPRFIMNCYFFLLIELLVNLNKPRFVMFTVPIYNARKVIGFFNLRSNDMDKSWMMKPKISKEYIDDCRSFVDFAILNCRTPDGLIFYLRKTSSLGMRPLDRG